MPHRNLNLDGYFFSNGYIVSENNRKLVAEHYFDADDIFFDGHFPGRPIVPGVILLKWLMEAINILIGINEIDKTVKVYKINNVRFRKIIHPREWATIKVILANDIFADELNYSVSIFTDDKCVTIGEMSTIMK
jgi:3-hydroxymyristoyl/3-hydroxydecanoyl-(acyl carrier protein) dehydratase